MILPILFSFASLFAADTLPAKACARTGPAAVATQTFVNVLPARRGDSTVMAVVCFSAAPSTSGATKFGSYHGELSFDSSTAVVLRVDKNPGGMRVENTRFPGRVNFAGADPTGFSEGAQIAVVLRLRSASAKPDFRLQMLELNSPTGEDLLKSRHVASPAAPAKRPSPPRLH